MGACLYSTCQPQRVWVLPHMPLPDLREKQQIFLRKMVQWLPWQLPRVTRTHRCSREEPPHPCLSPLCAAAPASSPSSRLRTRPPCLGAYRLPRQSGEKHRGIPKAPAHVLSLTLCSAQHPPRYHYSSQLPGTTLVMTAPPSGHPLRGGSPPRLIVAAGRRPSPWHPLGQPPSCLVSTLPLLHTQQPHCSPLATRVRLRYFLLF